MNLLVHSPEGHSDQDHVKKQPGARNFISVSSMGGRGTNMWFIFHCLFLLLAGTGLAMEQLECEQGSTWDVGVTELDLSATLPPS